MTDPRSIDAAVLTADADPGGGFAQAKVPAPLTPHKPTPGDPRAIDTSPTPRNGFDTREAPTPATPTKRR